MDRNRVTLQGTVREAPPCSESAIQSALVQILDGPDAGKSGLTDREGLRYAIAGVAWGTFRVRASKDGYAPSEVTVTVPASDTVDGRPLLRNFDLVRTLTQALFGEIRERRTEHGALIPGARVEVTSGPAAGRSTISNSIGRYRLEQLATGTLTVRVTTAGYVEEIATISLCGDRQLDFRLTPRNARFEGTVFDTTSGSTPLGGATVQILSGAPAGQTAVTNASGHYNFTGVYGTFTVRAFKAGYTTEERTITVTDPIVFWNFGLRRQ